MSRPRIIKTEMVEGFKAGFVEFILLKCVIGSDSMKKVIICVVLVTVIVAVGIFICHEEIPVLQGNKANTRVRIGVTGFKEEIDSTLYMQGIQLALEKYQADHKGKNEIELVVMDDQGDINTGLRVAQNFVNDPSIKGVLGHWDSRIAIPASDIYENAKLPMLSPVVSNPKLYNSNKNYIFGTIPGDVYIADIMAQYAESKNYQRMAVYYDDDLYGIELSKAFCKSAEKRGIIIIDRHANFVNELETELTIQKWKTLECQAVFIADGLPDVGIVIHAIKGYGLNVPILGDWGLDLSDVIGEIGVDSENLVYPTLFEPNASRKELRKFRRNFFNRFQKEPDLWALLGYDAMSLMGYAIDQTKSVSRKDIAAALRSVQNWPGVSYNMTFNANGELTNPRVVIKKVVNGRFLYER